MNASTQAHPAPTAVELDSRMVIAGLVAFAAVNFGLAIFMVVAPHAFYTAIGPFGGQNDHYLRDVATYNAALGVGLLVAVRRISWRVPMLAIVTVQFALHSVNHLFDIGDAHPTWIGYFDFFALAAATLQLAWLTRLAARTSESDPKGDSS